MRSTLCSTISIVALIAARAGAQSDEAAPDTGAPRDPAAEAPAAAPPAPSAAPPPGSFAPQGSPLAPGQPPAPVVPAPQAAPAPVYPAPRAAPAPAAAAPSYPAAQPQAAQRAEAPSYTLPPLPPGYIYMPVPTGKQAGSLSPEEVARRDQLHRQLFEVERRLSALQHERVGIAGPLTLMVVGYGGSLLSTAVALAAFDSAERIQRGWYSDRHDYKLDYNDDGDIDEQDERRFRKTARIAAGVSAATLFIGFVGTARLVKRLSLRRAQRFEMRDLTQQRHELRLKLDYAAVVSPAQTGLNVRGSF